MTLTIAIPTFNKEKYIERCIKSVLVQSSLVNEILVIDNCSTDKTLEIAKTFEPQVKCVKNSSNLGMAGNWNRCIELCNSDLLMILHADDELLPNALAKYVDFFNQHPALGFVHADFYYVQDGDYNTKELVDTHSLAIATAGPEAMALEKGYACSTLMIPKKVYTQVGEFVQSMSSDLEMLERIASKYDVGHINQPTAYVHVNSDSTGRSSLVNRTVEQIITDANNLSNKIVSYYPPGLQAKMAKKFRDSTGGVMVLVFGQNLKAGNYKKSLQALFLALFKYWVWGKFVQLIFIYFKRKLWLHRQKG